MYLVGDPVQLPATVISARASAACYERSLFSRLQGGGFPVQMLDTQYRMHPRIAAFPSAEFYGGALRNGDGVAAATARAWHAHAVGAPGCKWHACLNCCPACAWHAHAWKPGYNWHACLLLSSSTCLFHPAVHSAQSASSMQGGPAAHVMAGAP